MLFSGLIHKAFFLVYGLLFAVILMTFMSSAARSEVTADDIRRKLRHTHSAIDGVDTVLDSALGMPVRAGSLTWIDVFGYMLSVEEVADSLKKRNYANAVVKASQSTILLGMSRTMAGTVLSNAFAVGRLGALSIELYLNVLKDGVVDKALEWQINAYIMVRDAPYNLSHQDVLNSQSRDKDVLFEDGWIKQLDNKNPAYWRPVNYDPAQVFDLASGIYDAKVAAPNLPTERARLVKEFGALLCQLRGDTTSAACGGDQVACHHIIQFSDFGSFPRNFGVPYNVLSAEQEPVIQGLCGKREARIVVGSGMHTQMVYKEAYVYLDGSWQRVNLSGAKPVAGSWYIGRAEATFPVTEELLKNGIYVVAYMCTWAPWTSQGWKCGCRDRSCQTSFWQLQRLLTVGDIGSLLAFIWLDRSIEPIETDWLSSSKMYSLSDELWKKGFFPEKLEGKDMIVGGNFRALFKPISTYPFSAWWYWGQSEEAFQERKQKLEGEGYETIFENMYEAGTVRKRKRYQAVWTKKNFQ